MTSIVPVIASPFSQGRDAGDGKHILYAFLASALVHLAILARLPLAIMSDERDTIVVTLRSEEQPSPEQPLFLPEQIVSQPESPEEAPLKETNLRSERDSRATVEQIRRGDSLAKPGEQAEQAPREQPTLRLNEQLLEKHFGNTEENKEQSLQGDTATMLSEKGGSKPDASRMEQLASYKPFSGGDLFSSQYGSSDYLPNIPDGDVTLLNTKADRYAVFVRRVALQVFGALRREVWQAVPGSEMRKISDFALVEATLTADGKLLRVKLLESSGSPQYDRVLTRAAQEGSWDQNPPTGATGDDGHIHFVFKSRAWVRGGGHPGMEQRWMLLGTGLL